MKKNIEVEFRALVKDIEEFQKKLTGLGAEYKSSSYLCDIYFCEKETVSVEDLELDKVGSYSLRLRVTRKDDKEIVTINTKTITNEGDHNAWKENEIIVNSSKEAAKIMSTMGFKPSFKLEKNRHRYIFNDMEVLVEDITDFGGAVEVEIMCSPGKEDVSKTKIKKLLISDLGLSKSDIVPKSVTNMIMRQRAFKQKITF